MFKARPFVFIDIMNGFIIQIEIFVSTDWLQVVCIICEKRKFKEQRNTSKIIY